MRTLVPRLAAVLLVLSLAAPAMVACEARTNFGSEATFTIENVDTRVVDLTEKWRIFLTIDLTGAHNGSEGSSFLVDLDVAIKATAPDGSVHQIPTVKFRHTEPARMHNIEVPLYFELEKHAPRGTYQINVEVADRLGEQTRTAILAVEL